MRRSYSWADHPAARLVAAKRGRRITVCIPARDEEGTVGPIVATIRRDLMDNQTLVDEILVMDDGSQDATASVAAAAGARVCSTAEVLPDYPAQGKGQAMWKGVHAAGGDLIVFCDADVRQFHAGYVLGLVAPLLLREDVAFVKGFYERPVDGGTAGGGRVTELVARPLISLFFPHLADLAQPLAGECAARRDVLESVPFAGGYGVDLGLLIDVTARYGNASLVQCDLGERIHRNRSLAELGPQALSIMQLALERAGVAGDDFAWSAELIRPTGEAAEVSFLELPPLAEVPAHRKTA